MRRISLYKVRRVLGKKRSYIFAVFFAVLGSVLLLSTKAVTPTVHVEAESGTLTSSVTKINDVSASGSSAVQFGTSVTGAATKLTWSPPANWQNYATRSVSSATSLNTVDGNGGDVRILLPTTPVGPITIRNCRNVVIIGGQINLLPSAKVNSADQRAVYVNGCTGIVHIEGVYINGDVSGAEGDGIAINAPLAIVQVQNVKIHKLFGAFDKTTHNHSDIIQPWGGVAELRVDRLTGTTNYQGLQINRDLGDVGKVIIKNTNVGDSGVPSIDGKGGYYVWLACNTGTTYTFLENLFVQPWSTKTLANSVWGGDCGMQTTTDTATFTNSNVMGDIKKETPTMPDFVPDGTTGVNYVSPGYL